MTKIKYIGILFLLFNLFVLKAISSTPLQIIIDQGVKKSIPIAVNFEFNGSVEPSQSLLKIVSDDLVNSGFFSIVNKIDYPQSINDDLKPQLWTNKNIRYLIKGKIDGLSDNSYIVTYQVIDLIGLDRLPGSIINTVNAKFTNNDLRSISHNIADNIFETIVGVKGDFSTKIAYVVQPIQGINNYELYVSDYDGYNKVLIDKSKSPIISPTWSYDNSILAYTTYINHKAVIAAYNLKQGTKSILINFKDATYIGSPSFSHDGKYIAFTQSDGMNFDIYLHQLNTDSYINLTRGIGNNTEVSWNKDNIIFTSDRYGVPKIFEYNFLNGGLNIVSVAKTKSTNAVISNFNNSLYYIAADRLVEQNLSTGLVKNITNTYLDENPTVSPHGIMIIYTSTYNTKKQLNLLSVYSNNVKKLSFSLNTQISYASWSN